MAIDEVREIVERHFPNLWFYVEACLSTIATLYISDIDLPASLILTGPPSSGKTTVLNFFRNSSITYWSDKFTPASFVSLMANKTEEELRDIDLLPRIKGKSLIVPDLGPMFSDRKDVLIRNIGILTRVLDGDGLLLNGGTHRQRGYTGKHQFTFLGAITYLGWSKWREMGKLGNRLCFMLMPEDIPIDFRELFARELRTGIPTRERTTEISEIISGYLQLHSNHIREHGKYDWDRDSDDQDLVSHIVALAEVSGVLRGVIPRMRLTDGRYHKCTPLIEKAERFSVLLYNLARGRALIHERRNIDETDLDLVTNVALSSCYQDRSNLVRSLIENEGNLATNQIQSILRCSRSTALDLMEDLSLIDLTEDSTMPLEGGGTMNTISLRRDFDFLLPS